MVVPRYMARTQHFTVDHFFLRLSSPSPQVSIYSNCSAVPISSVAAGVCGVGDTIGVASDGERGDGGDDLAQGWEHDSIENEAGDWEEKEDESRADIVMGAEDDGDSFEDDCTPWILNGDEVKTIFRRLRSVT